MKNKTTDYRCSNRSQTSAERSASSVARGATNRLIERGRVVSTGGPERGGLRLMRRNGGEVAVEVGDGVKIQEPPLTPLI